LDCIGRISPTEALVAQIVMKALASWAELSEPKEYSGTTHVRACVHTHTRKLKGPQDSNTHAHTHTHIHTQYAIRDRLRAPRRL